MIFRRLLRAAAALPVLALVCAAASAQTPPPGFHGTWRMLSTTSVVANVRGGPPAPGKPPPTLAALLPLLKPEAAARIMAAGRAAPGAVQDRGYCAPPTVSGPSGFFLAPPAAIPVGFEILPGAGWLTMVDETNLVRRLYLRDKVPVDALDESNGGTSIARMEGKTLVVRTSGLNSIAKAILGIAGTELGGNARMLERMTLVEPDVLEIVTTVTAPALYAAPMTSTARFRRDDKRILLELSICLDNDRSYDLRTGVERFDATPPADLPPPPR